MVETPTSIIHHRIRRWQELGDRFHMMIGYCIGAWADVDDALFQVFRECLGPLDQSAIIYFKTPGLDVRFSLTDEIVRSVLPEPERKDGGHKHEDVLAWENTIKGHQDLLHTRRRIAHHPAAIRHDGGLAGFLLIGVPTPLPSWYEIYMSEHEKLRGKKADAPALRIEDLERHIEAVGDLGDRLRAFLSDVLLRPAEEPRLPTPSPP
jgi:hypothetical protein